MSRPLRIHGLSGLIAILLAGRSLADGKFYGTLQENPAIPFQQALIHHDGGKELLIIQSKFEGEPQDLGWVIPAPSPPRILAFKEDSLFLSLMRLTMPEVIHFKYYILFSAWAVFVVLSAVAAFRMKKWGLFFVLPNLLALFLLGFFSVERASFLAPRGREEAVEVISRQTVGIFDVQVIRGKEARAMVDWLKERRFAFDAQDERAFQAYMDRGWCFAAVRIRRDIEGAEIQARDGLVKPLGLYFDAPEPVYPLVLTAASGTPQVEVLLYAYGARKMAADPRFDLEFADKIFSSMIDLEELELEEGSGELPPIPKEGFLAKYRGILDPRAMEQDLVLKPAPDQASFRKRVWRWFE